MTFVIDIVRLEKRVSPPSDHPHKTFQPGDKAYESFRRLKAAANRTAVLELAQTVILLAIAFFLSLVMPHDPVHSTFFYASIPLLFTVALLKWRSAYSNKIHRERLQRAQVHAILAHIATEVLCGARGRITWFRPRSTNPSYPNNYVVPFSRYDPLNPTPDPRSRAYYPFNVSYTGLAAANPNKVIVCEFPSFDGDRSLMEKHYSERLLIPHRFLSRISNYMLNVRAIVSYGLELEYPKRMFLGVLSIDLLDPPDQAQLEHRLAKPEFRVFLSSLSDLEATAQLYGRS